jgi:formylglycine-generating enzyme required for sulfatase activity
MFIVTGCHSSSSDSSGGNTPVSSSSKALTSFSIVTPSSTGTISETAKTVSVTVPFGTAVTALIADFTTTGETTKIGSTVQVSSTTLNDFTSPVPYIVTASDGTTATYTVTVTVSPGYASANIGNLEYVPAGSFQRDPTSTDISVISTAFRMSQNLITRAQFLAVMGTDPSNATYSSGLNDPVQMVNWYMAITFCNKLSLLEGLTPVYSVTGINFSTLTYANIPTTDTGLWNEATATLSNNGYRLPTEMQYIWAAMGATADSITTDFVAGVNTSGYFKGYAGSSETGGAQVNINNYAWTLNITPTLTTSQPVGTKLPNELGLYDMSGNVREWIGDLNSSTYPTGTLTDYTGAALSANRTILGNMWNNGAGASDVDCRIGGDPADAYLFIGFRVSRP